MSWGACPARFGDPRPFLTGLKLFAVSLRKSGAMSSSYAVAAVRARPDGGPMRPWHAVDLRDDDPVEHEGEFVVGLCGAPMLRAFPLQWGGLRAEQGCQSCRARARSAD